MNKIEEKKKLLQQKINRLKEKEAKIKITERKQRTRRLIEMGGLVEKAGLSNLSTTQLLGALLEIKSKSEKENNLNSWAKAGEDEFNKNKSKIENERAIIIRFPEEPDTEIRKKLRSFGMRWNSVRKEWEGIANPDLIKSELEDTEMTLQELSVA